MSPFFTMPQKVIHDEDPAKYLVMSNVVGNNRQEKAVCDHHI